MLGTIKRIGSKFKRSYMHRKMMYDIDHQKGTIITISISDLMHLFFRNTEMTRLDIVVRLLAVENYFGLNQNGFDIYEETQRVRKSDEFSKKSVEKFRNLIKSYQERGYDESSLISLDKSLMLIDGSHRIAMGIYNNFPTINALVVPDGFKVDYSLDWFIGEGFSKEYINIINQKANDILKQYSDSIACIIWEPAIKWTEEIIDDLSYYGEIKDCKMLTCSVAEFEKIVRSIYSLDDIAEWKIDKKIEHMAGSSQIAYIELDLRNPLFRIKKISNMPLCVNGEKLKKAIRDKYSKRMDDYFNDIIIHTADNYTQSSQIRKIVGEIYENKNEKR